MSTIEMSSNLNISYQKLINEVVFDEEALQQEAQVIKTKSCSRQFRRLSFKRRLKIRIPGLRRFLRKKDKIISAVKVSCNKVIQRLLEGKSHMGDLFAGNYLFMHVSPTPFKNKCPEKYVIGPDHIKGLPSNNARHSAEKIA
ncbi:hypothetical protein AQUCO_00100163v1 [Aquilegia coerulea]|uniref:Uncharacterized protein n=1 Tax=Aquilegia coerulea TaxID=218851 RepID=A0A2G5F974_AQUCA|nr:hypothetical protein AQUCO_01100436v1 [Aquilegia coerulea]PIA64490.1 hypothetical protein AQUCO_00100163v1 [Aquilegia coerulea]